MSNHFCDYHPAKHHHKDESDKSHKSDKSDKSHKDKD